MLSRAYVRCIDLIVFFLQFLLSLNREKAHWWLQFGPSSPGSTPTLQRFHFGLQSAHRTQVFTHRAVVHTLVPLWWFGFLFFVPVESSRFEVQSKGRQWSRLGLGWSLGLEFCLLHGGAIWVGALEETKLGKDMAWRKLTDDEEQLQYISRTNHYFIRIRTISFCQSPLKCCYMQKNQQIYVVNQYISKLSKYVHTYSSLLSTVSSRAGSDLV